MNGASINKLDRVGTWFDHKLNNILCNNTVKSEWWLSPPEQILQNGNRQIVSIKSWRNLAITLKENFILPTSLMLRAKVKKIKVLLRRKKVIFLKIWIGFSGG